MIFHVEDDFLSKEDHQKIKESMLSNEFPWFVSPILDSIKNDIDGQELSHSFYSYDDDVYSIYTPIIYPLLKKINPVRLHRIRAALMPRNNERKENAWHIDFKDIVCTTAIYYVNSNDGYTKFHDGSIVESVENRFVFFASNNLHTGTHCTDSNFRCLINLNYD